MDKQRHPNVVCTWTIERTKLRSPSPPAGEAEVKIAEGSVRWAIEQSDPPSLAT